MRQTSDDKVTMQVTPSKLLFRGRGHKSFVKSAFFVVAQVVVKGARNAANDTLTPLSDPPFSKDDENEGAFSFKRHRADAMSFVRFS